MSVVLADDAFVADLNRRYRGCNAATNVLSFPALGDDLDAAREALPADAPLAIGDVVVAFQTLSGEARSQGKSLEHHLDHLVVHGVLHLLGFDHADEAAAEEMETLERRILAALGVPDPYAADAAAAE